MSMGRKNGILKSEEKCGCSLSKLGVDFDLENIVIVKWLEISVVQFCCHRKSIASICFSRK